MGQYALVAQWSFLRYHFFLQIVDASNPTNFTFASRVESWSWPLFQGDGGWVFCAGDPIAIYEMTNQPTINSISKSNESVVLTWNYAPGVVLQRTTSLANPMWTDVPDSEDQSGITLPLAQAEAFFRLARNSP